MLLQWLTRISLVIIVFVIWYPISRHFLRTVLFWDNTCIYDYHNWSLCLDMLEWKQKVILRFHLLFVYIYLCYKCNPLFHHLMKVIPWYVLLLINTKTKKEFILKNNIFSFYWKYLRMVMQWFFDLSENEFGFTMHSVGYYTTYSGKGR